MSLDGKKLSVMNELDPDQQGICSATLSFRQVVQEWCAAAVERLEIYSIR
jgi:hypothetical protein